MAIECFERRDNASWDTSLVHNAVQRKGIALKMDAAVSGFNIRSSKLRKLLSCKLFDGMSNLGEISLVFLIYVRRFDGIAC